MIRFLLFVLFLAGSLFAQSGDWGPAPDLKPSYSVAYTGRLLGYFRYPDVQTTQDVGCPAENSVPFSAAVSEFQAQVRLAQSETSAPQVLVSMGDNFAPELLARSMIDKQSTDTRKLTEKNFFTAAENGQRWAAGPSTPLELLPGKNRNPGTVPSDNVACFLRLLGFRAVVPGEHDFYYGPERLRQVARFLAEPQNGSYSPVQMLAANLVISTTQIRPNPRLPMELLPRKLREVLQPSNSVQLKLPPIVMPWLRTVAVETKLHRITVFDCPAASNDPYQFALPSDSETRCVPLHKIEAQTNTFQFAPPSNPSSHFVENTDTLDPGSNHALCVGYAENGANATRCKVFSVQYPFLQFDPHSAGTTPAPYYVPAAGGNSPNIAIFGVVGPDLPSYIGKVNSAWDNQNPAFDTSVQALDPVESLRQVLELCFADANCKNRRKVLLAQMPYYAASALASKFNTFDLLIAQPDADHVTGNENSSRTLDVRSGILEERNNTYAQPGVLLAPGLPFIAGTRNALTADLRQVTFYLKENGKKVTQFFSNRVYSAAVKPVNSSLPFSLSGLDAAVRSTVGDAAGASVSQVYHDLALGAMLEFCQADAAILQNRDVFSGFDSSVAYWPGAIRYTPQQILDEIFWKGDFAVCEPVKGSTLKAMLQQSAVYNQQDRNDLSMAAQKGSGLRSLGVEFDTRSNSAFIRGFPVEDNRLYSVAMPDFLAFGNSGYPDVLFETTHPKAITRRENLRRISGLACDKLSPAVTLHSCQNETIDPSQYFAIVNTLPFDSTRGLTAWRQLRSWAMSPAALFPGAVTLVQPESNTLVSVAQRKGFWWFGLQNLDAEYDLSFIGGSDRTVPGNFAGINTFSQLSTPETSQLGFWLRGRGGYDFPKYIDFYASGEARYTRFAQRSADPSGNGNFGPYQVSLKNNVVRGELGIQSKPVSRKLPIRALVSENLLTQFYEPFLQLNVPYPCGTPNCVPNTSAQNETFASYPLGKNFISMTRIGLRIENRQSWFEGGREFGRNIGVPRGYVIQDAGRPPIFCNAAGRLSLGQCLNNGFDPYFTTESLILPQLFNQAIAGWFVDFHVAAPLYREKLQLVTDSYGEVFDKRSDDTNFNTRFYQDLTVALKVPLWGNLFIAPQLETFFYQNKVIPNQLLTTNHYVFVQTSIKLGYGFEWHQGISILKALHLSGATNTGATPPPAP